MSVLIPEDIVVGLRRHGYMVLPFEPNVADIAVMEKALMINTINALDGKPFYEKGVAAIYAALANRHRGVPEVDKPSQPSRVDKDID